VFGGYWCRSGVLVVVDGLSLLSGFLPFSQGFQCRVEAGVGLIAGESCAGDQGGALEEDQQHVCLCLRCRCGGDLSGVLAALGFAVGLTIVPQQHRLFATVPSLAPVAIGLNGSALYIASALGAGIGGLALAAGGRTAATLTAVVIGTLGLAVGIAVVPERHGG
jgi:hypothetical protein